MTEFHQYFYDRLQERKVLIARTSTLVKEDRDFQDFIFEQERLHGKKDFDEHLSLWNSREHKTVITPDYEEKCTFCPNGFRCGA